MGGEWVRQPTGSTSVVFVHGILSSGESCWRNGNGTYWPELLKNEAGLEAAGIYVYSYQTGFASGSYSLSNVVDDLKERFFNLDRVADSQKIVFVCHSMGGIVVRKLIVERLNDFLDRRIDIGLFLVASPSLGSDYANWLEPIARFAGHEQAKALRFNQDNQWLTDLDKTFMNLKESKRLTLYGKELLEDKFITLKFFLRSQVVAPFSGARYFGESFKVAGSDHFSIAKPENNKADQHRLLVEFIKQSGFSQLGKSANNLELQATTSNDSVAISELDDNPFVHKIRDKIKLILKSNKLAVLTLHEALLKTEPSNSVAEEILIPIGETFSPETSIRKLRRATETSLEQSPDQQTEIKKYANELMGWLILLCVNGKHLQNGGKPLIDLDKTTEIVVPVKTHTGMEVFVARLQERAAKFNLKGTDKALGEGFIDPADLEIGLLKSDRIREIKELIYCEVFKRKPPPSEDWQGRLKNTLEFESEDRNKMYYVTLSHLRYSEIADIIKQLKVDLPHLRILITGREVNNSNPILIMDESRLEALVLSFLNTLAEFQ
jgi:hypothetical protein